MDTLIGFGLLAFSVLCVVLLATNSWMESRDLQRWERKQSRRGGYLKPPASTDTNPQTGTPYGIGEATPHVTMADTKSTLPLGWPTDLPGTLLIPPTLRPLSKHGWPGESGMPTEEDGADSGPIPPENAA